MAYVANGGEILVNSTTDGVQGYPSITALTNGGFVVTWQNNSGSGEDTDGYGVIGQIFGADGSKVGGEFFVNTITTSDQQVPAVSALSGGGFVITWQDSSATGDDTDGSAVRGQVFDNNGTKVGTEFLANTTAQADQRIPSVAGLSEGGFVVVWADGSATGDDSSDSAVRMQIYRADGTKVPGYAETLVNTTTTADQTSPRVAALTGGGFVVTWTDSSESGADMSGAAVRARIFSSDGTPAGNDFVVNETTTGEQSKPWVIGLSDGGFVVVWQDSSRTGGDTSSSAIRGQRFLANGTKTGDEFLINTTVSNVQSDPSVAALPGGGFIVSWADFSQTGGDTSAEAIRAQVFAADGSKSGSEFLVNTSTNLSQNASVVAVLNNGGFAIAWQDESHAGDDASDMAVRARLYSVASANCYLAGSLVFTANGDVPVEQLRIGDLVLTASGQYRPIRWVGITTIPARLLATDDARRDCLPLIVRKGAMHDAVPSQDLYCAPWHPVVGSGAMVPLLALANGVSIVQDGEIRDLTYYNVELDEVDVILVNRLPVLSLHPKMSPRYRFDNCDDYFTRYPDGVAHDRAQTVPVGEMTRADAAVAAAWLNHRAKTMMGLSADPIPA